MTRKLQEHKHGYFTMQKKERKRKYSNLFTVIVCGKEEKLMRGRMLAIENEEVGVR